MKFIGVILFFLHSLARHARGCQLTRLCCRNCHASPPEYSLAAPSRGAKNFPAPDQLVSFNVTTFC